MERLADVAAEFDLEPVPYESKEEAAPKQPTMRKMIKDASGNSMQNLRTLVDKITKPLNVRQA